MKVVINEANETSQTLAKKCVEVNHSKTKKKHVILILDIAHREMIEPNLPAEYQWEIFAIESTKTIKKLEESSAFKKSLKKAGIVCFLTGSQDLMYTKPPSTYPDNVGWIYENLKLSCERLSKKITVQVCTIPPNKMPTTSSEVPILNRMIMDLKSRVTVINTQEQFSEIPKSKAVEQDGVTLSSKSTQILCDAICEAVCHHFESNKNANSTDTSVCSEEGEKENMPEDPLSTSTPQPELQSQVLVEIPSDLIKHVIRKGHKGIEMIQRQSGASLEVKKWDNDGVTKQGIMVKGTRKAVKKATDTIEQIVKDQRERQMGTNVRAPPNMENVVCNHYKTGSCFKGARCKFAHPGHSEALDPTSMKVMKV